MPFMLRVWLGIAVLLSTGIGRAAEPATTWRAGTSAITITPDKPMWLSGYATRDRPAEGKISDLHAKALVLEDPTGQRAVVVTMDLVGISRDFAAAFEQCDVLLSPTTPFVAFPFGSRTSDPYQMYLADLYTIPTNLYGGPAISVPCGLSEGLPVGLQVMAPTMADDRMYRVAAALESVVPAPQPPAL